MQSDVPTNTLNYGEHPARPWYYSTTVARISLFLIATVLLLLAAAALDLLPHNYRTEQGERLVCANRLRLFGFAALLYAGQHGGQFPNDLQTLCIGNGTPRDLFCPAVRQTLKDDATDQQAIDAIAAHQTSYIYTGKGVRVESSKNTVVMYEPLTDHGSGMNVLFADAHVEWLNVVEANKLLARFAAGEHPVQYERPATAPSTVP
jgi:prepilin-type processing-associated H-X9-DG protein